MSEKSSQAHRRLIQDFKKIQSDAPEGIEATPSESNISEWEAIIIGPSDTPWEGGIFQLTLSFPNDYPNKPPTVKFVTPMFHPNIYKDGNICLDILKTQWSPIFDVSAILTSIQSLLSDPNPASPANQEAAQLYNDNRPEYNRRVREVVEKTWEEDGES